EGPRSKDGPCVSSYFFAVAPGASFGASSDFTFATFTVPFACVKFQLFELSLGLNAVSIVMVCTSCGCSRPLIAARLLATTVPPLSYQVSVTCRRAMGASDAFLTLIVVWTMFLPGRGFVDG